MESYSQSYLETFEPLVLESAIDNAKTFTQLRLVANDMLLNSDLNDRIDLRREEVARKMAKVMLEIYGQGLIFYDAEKYSYLISSQLCKDILIEEAELVRKWVISSLNDFYFLK